MLPTVMLCYLHNGVASNILSNASILVDNRQQLCEVSTEGHRCEIVMSENEPQHWHIAVTVHGKTTSISVGDASQRVKWLAHVAISKWDAEDAQGWKLLGIPISVWHGKREIDMGLIIRDVLQDGDEVTISSSLLPFDRK
jgi:hypothetical protein